MAYNEKLETRLRTILDEREDVSAKKMFGGLAFMRDDKMFIGITNDDLMVRMSPEEAETQLKKKHVRPMDFTAKPMKGYIYVAPDGYKTKAQLEGYIDIGYAFAGTLPAKKKKK